MGWNTCHTSYSALIGYYLEHHAEILAQPAREEIQVADHDVDKALSSTVVRLRLGTN